MCAKVLCLCLEILQKCADSRLVMPRLCRGTASEIQPRCFALPPPSLEPLGGGSVVGWLPDGCPMADPPFWAGSLSSVPGSAAAV